MFSDVTCIFFDRDGTLGELTDKRFPQTFRPFADIAEVFRQIHQKGYIIGILTNQSSISRGTAGDYDYAAEFASYGADLWEICPHDDRDHCNCRKPKSGLLLAAAQKLNIPLKRCLVIGDRLSDVQCAKNVGAQAALVMTGYGEKEKLSVAEQYPDVICLSRFDDLLSLLP
ncbi:MAG: HAD-IIIA family hydrolase [Clostridia bacterium]|nr:HAD-IIIA family hydrolase [Clostridia bacterium]